ncbi:hypothetical protein [Candidatus Amarobacter glycogenicus]|uniref:hypothetical protein n=1 Tax=Candidatus Amarobacter glycogenicus TaxID=3140699 RepID=UPI0031360D57|nr:hypothetical protein [Dehalococcoidia bacterium]
MWRGIAKGDAEVPGPAAQLQHGLVAAKPIQRTNACGDWINRRTGCSRLRAFWWGKTLPFPSPNSTWSVIGTVYSRMQWSRAIGRLPGESGGHWATNVVVLSLTFTV